MSESEKGPKHNLPRKESDVMFFTYESGPRLVYDAGTRKCIVSSRDLTPEWGMHIMHLREMRLQEGGSLKAHIMRMMTCMNELEYIDANFDRNLAVDVLLHSLPDSYNDFLWDEYRPYEDRSWIEMVNLLRRYEETGAPEKKRKLREAQEAQEAKERMAKMFHYNLDPQAGPSKRVADAYAWEQVGNRKRGRDVDPYYVESTDSSSGT